MIDQIELKNMHSKELRTLRNMIREELDFRADVGREIDERKKKENWTQDAQGIRKKDCILVNLNELRGGQ